MAKTVYFAAGWFTPKQNAAYEQVMARSRKTRR